MITSRECWMYGGGSGAKGEKGKEGRSRDCLNYNKHKRTLAYPSTMGDFGRPEE